MPVSAQITEARAAIRKSLPTTVRRLQRDRDLSDVRLALLSGVKRTTLHSRLSGKSPFTDEELVSIATVLDVPVVVLFLSPDNALRWVLDHPTPGAATVAGASVVPANEGAVGLRSRPAQPTIPGRPAGPAQFEATAKAA